MMNYIKRRFSSSDLQDDNDDRQENNIARNFTTAISKISNPTTSSHTSTDIKTSQSSYTKPSFKMNFPSPSAPNSQANSPTKSLSISSMMSVAKDIVADTFHSGIPTKQSDLDIATHNRSLKDKIKHILVIDDLNIDWTRYFKGRKVDDFILRVDQVTLS